MSSVTMTAGARVPILTGRIRRAEGLAFGIDAQDIAEVRLRIRSRGVTPGTDYLVDAPVDEWTMDEDGTEIAWSYAWAEGDTDTPGRYEAQVRVRLTDGRDAFAPTAPRGLPVRVVQVV
jgi:hypothetical protein